MSTRPQFSRLWHVSPHDPRLIHVSGLVVFCCREAAFSNYQIVHGLPPPHFSHPDSLEYWYLRHETVLSLSAPGDQTWGILGRYSVAEDATCIGLA